MRYLTIPAMILALSASNAWAEPENTHTSATQTHEKWLPKEEWEKLSAEEKREIKKQRFEAREAKRKEWKIKYDSASPEEKERMKEELRAKHEERKIEWKKRYDAATPEEKKRMEERVEKRREHRQEKWQEKYDAASPEEKKAMDERRAEWKAKHEKAKEE